MKPRAAQTLLSRGEIINDTYTVRFFIGGGAFGEVYRVEHRFLGNQAFKVIRREVETALDLERIADEARILARLTHPNIVRVFDVNRFERAGHEHHFITMSFVSGETLTKLLEREITLSKERVLAIQKDLLSGLKAAHELDPPVVHRDIHSDNILLSYADEARAALLSDFGLACALDPRIHLAESGGRYSYMAPECYWGVHLPTSDVFSAGVVLYRMLTGAQPWEYDLSGAEKDPEEVATRIISARRAPFRPPSILRDDCGEALDAVVARALALEPGDRFRNAADFLEALVALDLPSDVANTHLPVKKRVEPVKPAVDVPRKVSVSGKGLDAIAGMDEFKEAILQDVILPLKDPKLYLEYKVSMPNGILLFGPPGCGKTFVSRKLAEEVDYHFVEIKPSALASIYVHGTQEKIGKIFDEARGKAPSIIFIDEVDAILPSREGGLQHSYASEVNEFLAQMTECHERGIFVIAATNRPDRIDPAILRTGRIDKVFYLGPPDTAARIELFRMYLADRPFEDGIDIERLASLTEMHVSSDIKFLVNEASRNALKERSRIAQRHLEAIIERTAPSVSAQQIKKYEEFKAQRSFS